MNKELQKLEGEKRDKINAEYFLIRCPECEVVNERLNGINAL